MEAIFTMWALDKIICMRSLQNRLEKIRSPKGEMKCYWNGEYLLSSSIHGKSRLWICFAWGSLAGESTLPYDILLSKLFVEIN